MKLIKTSFIALFISALLFLPLLSQESQSELLKAEVTRVIDGDTIEVRLTDGTKDKIRYIGMDTPEVHGGVECYGKEASAYNAALVENKTVWLELDVQQRDKYNRLLAYVYLGPKGLAMVNAILVVQGYAQIATYPPNVKHVELFRELQKGAREDGRGLWCACEDVCPSNDKTRTCQACLDKLNEATYSDFKEVSGIGDTLASRLVQAQPFEPSVCKSTTDLEVELQKISYIGVKRSRAIVEHFCPELH